MTEPGSASSRGSEPSGGPAREPGVGSAATADDELVRALYREHGGALLGYVLGLLGGDRQRAEDVVQETFFRAWQRPSALDPSRGSIRSWLLTIARNIVIDGERARKARPPEVGEEVLGSIPTGTDEFDNAVVAYDVAGALAELSAHHREAIVEVYYRGRSVAEAAQALGVPAGTVKSRTYYGLRQLRLLLEERGMTPEAGL